MQHGLRLFELLLAFKRLGEVLEVVLQRRAAGGALKMLKRQIELALGLQGQAQHAVFVGGRGRRRSMGRRVGRTLAPQQPGRQRHKQGH